MFEINCSHKIISIALENCQVTQYKSGFIHQNKFSQKNGESYVSIRKIDDNSNFFVFYIIFQYITNEGSVLTFKTNLDAPKYKLINIDLEKPGKVSPSYKTNSSCHQLAIIIITIIIIIIIIISSSRSSSSSGSTGITGELGYDRPLFDGFLHMTDDMLGPSPMQIKYSSYAYDRFCI